MIYINHKKKAIFIHIPKTGGTYIGPTLVKYYGFISYLDLIAYREVSNAIASKFNVFHESPQILLIQNGKCTYHASHSDITLEKVDVLL